MQNPQNEYLEALKEEKGEAHARLVALTASTLALRGMGTKIMRDSGVEGGEKFMALLGEVTAHLLAELTVRRWLRSGLSIACKRSRRWCVNNIEPTRFYSPEDCRRRARQHWEMAGLARQDMDSSDAERHTKLARLWEARAETGGWIAGED